MADNTQLNAGSGGDFIASDDIGGVKYQRVKPAIGADGTAVDAVPVSAGLDTTGTAVQAVGLVAQLDDVTPSSVTENQFGPVRMSTRRALLVEGVASGTVIPVSDGGGSITVDWAGTAPPIGAGLEATALRVTLATDSTGLVSVDDNGGSLTVDGTITANLAAGTNTNEVVGDAAHDAAIAGNPVRVGGRGLSADYTAVTTGDTTDLITSLLGKLITVPYALPGQTWSYAAASGGITTTTGVTAQAAGGVGVRNYITSCQVINGHATVSTDVQIRDGAAGTVLHRGFAQAAGGGYAVRFDPPLRGTANTLVEVACGTTGSATYVSLQGFTAAE